MDTINKEEFAALFGMIGWMCNELAMIKGMNQVLLKMIATDKGFELENVKKEIESFYASYNLISADKLDQIVRYATDEDYRNEQGADFYKKLFK